MRRMQGSEPGLSPATPGEIAADQVCRWPGLAGNAVVKLAVAGWRWWCRDLTGPLTDDEDYETGDP